MEPWKEAAFRNRLKDKSWGYAIAHYIPLVWIYYAWTRRTLTPTFWLVGGNLVIGFFIGFFFSEQLTTDESMETMGTLVAFVTTPFLAKWGIEGARNYANKILTGKESQEGYLHKLIFGTVISDRAPKTPQEPKQALVTTSEQREKLQESSRSPNEVNADQVSPDNSIEVEELLKLKDMFEKGLINEEEYVQLKKRVLGL